MSILFPSSVYPVTADRVFAWIHVGGGANSKHDEGLGVEASLGADAIWRLRFQLPPTLPSGTGKLRLVSLSAPSLNGVAKVNPKWASVADGEDPSSATLNAEGTTTITHNTTSNDKFVMTKITLDADTLVAGEIVVMDLTFETSGWTINEEFMCQPAIIWE